MGRRSPSCFSIITCGIVTWGRSSNTHAQVHRLSLSRDRLCVHFSQPAYSGNDTHPNTLRANRLGMGNCSTRPQLSDGRNTAPDPEPVSWQGTIRVTNYDNNCYRLFIGWLPLSHYGMIFADPLFIVCLYAEMRKAALHLYKRESHGCPPGLSEFQPFRCCRFACRHGQHRLRPDL